MKRLLSCNASDFKKMSPAELKQAIAASEGRTICSEMVNTHEPLIHDITNAETARAVGADLILLNLFDCLEPLIPGIDDTTILNYQEKKRAGQVDPEVIYKLKNLVRRPIGVNLEPIDETAMMLEDRTVIPKGRQCTKETLEAADKLGFDFICITGNPGTGVSNQSIIKAIAMAKEYFHGLIIAGKMHGAGVNEPILDKKIMQAFVDNGVDILLIPAIGTVPGVDEKMLKEIVTFAKEKQVLTMTTIGTSQESSGVETIREIALRNKILGVDIQHIGDSGYNGMANVENIYEMSVAIRGRRHTLSMMARSIER